MASKQRKCKECGETFQCKAKGPQQDFCSTPCRKAFNNRRMTRGAVLYDLFMGVRYERDRKSGNLALMSTLARLFRDEDNAIRDGRKSWGSDGNMSGGRDFLTEVADTVHKNIAAHQAKSV